MEREKRISGDKHQEGAYYRGGVTYEGQRLSMESNCYKTEKKKAGNDDILAAEENNSFKKVRVHSTIYPFVWFQRGEVVVVYPPLLWFRPRGSCH